MEGKTMFHKPPLVRWIPAVLACVWLAAGCRQALPPELQKKTGISLSNRDARVCAIMTSDTASAARIDGAVLPSPAILAWNTADDAFIRANLDTIPADRLVLVRNPLNEDTIYAFYGETAAGASAGTAFFVSWDLKPGNIDATADFAAFDAGGNRVALTTGAMSLDLAAACTQTVETGGQPAAFPKIRGMASGAFSAVPPRFLIRFILSKPQAIGTLQLAVLRGNGSGL
jgi:hypothetical protein